MVAEPSAVANPTVTGCGLAGERLTVKRAVPVPMFPSTSDTSPIDTDGAGGGPSATSLTFTDNTRWKLRPPRSAAWRWTPKLPLSSKSSTVFVTNVEPSMRK